MSTVTQSYALRPDQPKSLTVEYSQNNFSGKLRDMLVTYEGKTLGKAQEEKDIRSGITMHLPNGDALKVQVKRNKAFGNEEVKIFVNDAPLKPSGGSLKETVNGGAWTLITIAGLSAAIGLGAVVLQIDELQRFGIGWGSTIASLLFMGLGFAIMRYGWVGFIALLTAILLYTLDTLYTVVAMTAAGNSPGFSIGLKVVVFILLLRALGASWQLAREPDTALMA